MHGLYLHIPFCTGKCPYCDFYSLGGAPDRQKEAYTQALCRQLRFFGESGWFSGPENRFSSLYIGGGTPPVLGEERLCRVLEAAFSSFSFLPGAEVTLEANPETVTRPLLESCKKAGVNRLSMGLQSGVEEEQRLLGRRHGNREVVRALEYAQAAGISNCSVDVMLALPGQTEERLAKTAEFLRSLPVRHLSAYLLKVEEGTPFASLPLELPGEEAAARQYLLFCRLAEEMGFLQYEISNFAQPGFESRHNLRYWECGTYLGLGPGAHSFFGGLRRFYPRDLEGYLSRSHSLFLPTEDGEGGDMEEYVMLGLRLKKGISLKTLREKYQVSPQKLQNAAQRLSPLQKAGLLEWKGDSVALTREGFLVSNSVIVEIIEALE